MSWLRLGASRRPGIPSYTSLLRRLIIAVRSFAAQLRQCAACAESPPLAEWYNYPNFQADWSKETGLIVDLQRWVDECAALTTPDSIHWCDGSQAEYDSLIDGMLKDE